MSINLYVNIFWVVFLLIILRIRFYILSVLWGEIVLSSRVLQINRENLCKIQLNIGKAAFALVYNNKSVCLIYSVSVVVTRNGKRKNLPNINITQQVNIQKLANVTILSPT